MDGAVYFMTEDEISRGLRTVGAISGQEFDPVSAPAAVESVVAELDGGLWKLNRYYSANGGGKEADPGSVPGADGPEEWELHDLVADPDERTNLAGQPGAPVEAMPCGTGMSEPL